MSTPYLDLKSPPRTVDSVTTLLIPSVLQKRPCANGRSAEITSTTAFGSAPAFSLKTLVDLAHTGVSRLGTMFSTLRLPAKSLSPTSWRSLAHKVKSGATSPFFGKLPLTVTGLPPSVTLAMRVLLLFKPFRGQQYNGERMS